MKKDISLSRLALITSMLIFGTIGVFRRYIDLPSGVIAMVRGFIGSASIIIYMFLSRKQVLWKAVKQNIIYLLVSGTTIAFNWIFLFEAIENTSVATATLCYYFAPIIVMLLSPFVFKERLNGKKIICIAAAFIGMVLVSGILKTGISGLSEIKGVLFGLSAAVFYAIIIVLNKKFKDINALDKTFIQLGVAGIVLIPYNVITAKQFDLKFTTISIIMLIVIGIIHAGVAYVLYFASMKKLKSQTIALFSYIDPVVAITLSAIFLNENIGISGFIGAALILGATFISEYKPVEPE